MRDLVQAPIFSKRSAAESSKVGVLKKLLRLRASKMRFFHVCSVVASFCASVLAVPQAPQASNDPPAVPQASQASNGPPTVTITAGVVQGVSTTIPGAPQNVTKYLGTPLQRNRFSSLLRHLRKVGRRLSRRLSMGLLAFKNLSILRTTLPSHGSNLPPPAGES